METPIGNLPDPSDLNLEGIDVPAETMSALLEVDTEAWRSEIAEIGEYLASYGRRTPDLLEEERARVAEELESS